MNAAQAHDGLPVVARDTGRTGELYAPGPFLSPLHGPADGSYVLAMVAWPDDTVSSVDVIDLLSVRGAA